MIHINFTTTLDQELIHQIFAELQADPMAGWLTCPHTITDSELAEIKSAAEQIRTESQAVVLIGIGGSYLGHRAVIEALSPASSVELIYAGNSLSQRELDRALAAVSGKDFSVVVISKSGTTLEPARAFAAFKEELARRYGAAAPSRIYAITDAKHGALHDEAVAHHYMRFTVPDDIGGRYSVLTPVGLLPLAIAGVDIDALLRGAASLSRDLTAGQLDSHPAAEYAAMRATLAAKGYDTEIFASFEPSAAYLNEWLKQLFGESEGKNHQGIWPASVIYTTDLHSLGQFIQDGRRNIWETIIDYPTDPVNAKAVAAVRTAHQQGGIPVLDIAVSSMDEAGLGELIYFFELSCAISAKLQGVNPFDQPGVEAYKRELKSLLAA